MNALYQSTLGVHFVAGIVALLSFWAPALARKGGHVHRKAGKLFVIAMLLVGVTALPLSLRFLLAGQWVGATFLLYLLVITMTGVGCAWYALKFKHEPIRYYGQGYTATAWLNILSGGIVLALGLAHGVTLLAVFSVIGLLAGYDMLKRRTTMPSDVNWWLQEHLGGMIAGGIAAHVAFGAFGLRRIWPAYGAFDGVIGMLPWILPVVIGVAASTYSSRKYRNGLRAPG